MSIGHSERLIAALCNRLAATVEVVCLIASCKHYGRAIFQLRCGYVLDRGYCCLNVRAGQDISCSLRLR